ncbi:MAG: DedA family protein [Planctomycetes bacterium]|nr:DedA family protein [Planctomycetota bacterium]
MIEHLTLALRGLVEHNAYPTIVGILYVCGLGVPIPEEITLLISGYAAYHGWVNLWLIMALCVAAILAGDLTMFLIARRWGGRLLKTRFGAWLFPVTRLEKVHRYFDKHGSKTVFFARFFAGIRMPVYFTAGMTKMNPVRFVLLDLAGTLISGPTSIFIAFKFSDNFDRAMKNVNNANHWIFGGMLVVIVLTVGWHLWKDHRERVAAKRELAQRASEGPPGEAPADQAAK